MLLFEVYELTLFQIEDEMIQCIICEDWYHGRVSTAPTLIWTLSVGKKNISSNIIQALPWYTYTYYLLHYIWNKSHLFKATLLFNSFRSISIFSEKEDMM